MVLASLSRLFRKPHYLNFCKYVKTIHQQLALSLNENCSVYGQQSHYTTYLWCWPRSRSSSNINESSQRRMSASSAISCSASSSSTAAGQSLALRLCVSLSPTSGTPVCRSNVWTRLHFGFQMRLLTLRRISWSSRFQYLSWSNCSFRRSRRLDWCLFLASELCE